MGQELHQAALTLADLSGESFTSGGREPPSRTNINFAGSAPATVTAPGVEKDISLREFLLSKMPTELVWKNDTERSEKLIFEFAQRGVPEQVIRWTGWSANIGEYAKDLPEVLNAFRGVKGFHMFGGTQILDLESGQVRATITDVPVVLKEKDPDLILIGIVPKVDVSTHLVQDIGLLVDVHDHSSPDKKDGYFTRVNPDINIGIMIQPDTNHSFTWSDEAKECLRLCANLSKKSWNTTLVVFGGRVSNQAFTLSTVEQELVDWSMAAKADSNDRTKILLIKGSGGVADKFANDAKWLSENPCAVVVDLNQQSIRDAINKLGLVTDWA